MSGILSVATHASPRATPAQFAEYTARVKRYATEAGRDPSSLDFAYSANSFNDQQAQTLPDGQRRPLTGTSQQIADDIKRYEELGVRHMMVNLQGETQAQTLSASAALRSPYHATDGVITPLAKEIRLFYPPRPWIISPLRSLTWTRPYTFIIKCWGWSCYARLAPMPRRVDGRQ